MAKKSGARGGSRPGAGRPRTRPVPPPKAPALPWAAIRAAAADGAEEAEIIRGLQISEFAMADPANLARFREELAVGHAKYKLELRRDIRRRGQRTNKGAGSTNVLALQARNILEWDKQLPTQEVAPDLGTARQRLRDLFVKLAASRSEIEGRTVTPLELLHRESESVAAATAAQGA